MGFLQNFINNLFAKNKAVYAVGPNNFAELLLQFDQPPKVKTQEEIIRDYQIKETMRALEVDMLKMDPSILYRGAQRFKDKEGNIYIDFVHCAVRPEVIYCSYGPN